jgi:glycosyltransferase involved in cell wall biosynthesis
MDMRFVVSHRLPVLLAAKDRGYDVHVAAPINHLSERGDAEAKARIEAAGVHCHEIAMDRGGMNPFKEITRFPAIYRLLRTLAPDLIHCVGMKPIIHGGIASRLSGVGAPIFAVTGMGSSFVGSGWCDLLRQRIILTVLKGAFAHPMAQIIFQNPDDQNLLEQGGAVSHAQTHLIKGAGADIEEFSPMKKQPRQDGGFTIAMAARLIEQKGFRDFIAAARLIRAVRSDCEFVIWGPRDPLSASSIPDKELLAWKTEGAVDWRGPADDMPNALGAADIFCYPSYYREGVPKVLIEAAAMGLPLITTDQPGCREVVEHEINGLLVPPRNPDALAEAILRLIDNADFRRSAGEKSRDRAEGEFSESAFVASSLEVYEAALNPIAPSAEGRDRVNRLL